MMWLITRPLVLSFKLLFGTTKMTTKMTTKATSSSFKLGYRLGRFVGFRQLAILALGIGIGLLLASITGAQNRGSLRQRFNELIGKQQSSPPPSPGTLLDFDREKIHTN